MLGTIVAAVAIFVGTDVDDLIVLTVLFLAGRAAHDGRSASSRAEGRPRVRDIVTGQYLGIAVLVAASTLAALGLLVIPDRWVGLLGLVPLTLGIRGLLASRGTERPVATGVFPIAALTIANGADNISVYVPVFRGIGPGASAVTIGTFAVMVAVWLALAYRLGSHRRIVETVERFGHWLVPVVFIAIGLILIARPIGIFARFV